MDDFASYSPKGKKEEDWIREAEETVKNYRGRSENDMLKAIYARAAEGKKNGTLTNAQIDAFYAQFAPMLDGMRRKKLQKLVEELKRM